MADTRTEEQKVKDIERCLEALIQVRQYWEPEIDEVITYINHGKRLITEKDSPKGARTGLEVYDGTALQALNILVDGMCGYSVSRSFRWFQYSLPNKLNFPKWSGMRAWSGKRMDEYPDVKNWLADCEEVMYACFLRSNLYDVMPDIVRDAASIGTVTPIMEEDLPAGRISFIVPHFRECYLAEDRFGVVDTCYRLYKLTLRHLVDKFGLDKMKEMDPSFELNLQANPYSEREVLHAVYPRKDFDPKRIDRKAMPVASVWLLREGSKKFLDESGYQEMPSISWRWRKNNDETYGRSPAWDAIVEVLTGQKQGKDNLIAGHKMADPPMVVPADLRGMVRTKPGGRTYVSSMEKQMPKPLVTGINLPYAVEQQYRTDRKIREHFHVDFFLMLSQAAMAKVNLTATQVLEMSGEKAAVLGTRIGRMETELMNPIHDRAFAIETRAGRIPTPPDILLEYSDEKIEVDYLGPLSQAQKKLFKSQGIRAGLDAAAPLFESFPDAADVFDPGETAKELMEASGFPVKLFRSKDDIKKIRDAKTKRALLSQAVAEGTEIAKALPGAGKAVEEGSPLEALTGLPGGNA
jgi:hypothetical protein